MMDMETPPEDLSTEEQVMKRLLHEWQNLNDRFIPDDQKTLYKQMFEHYLTTQTKKAVSSPESSLHKVGTHQTKPGKKKGRKTLQESIQLVGEMLINIGKIMTLTMVFQKNT